MYNSKNLYMFRGDILARSDDFYIFICNEGENDFSPLPPFLVIDVISPPIHKSTS